MAGKVKREEARSRRETESEQGETPKLAWESAGADPKPGDLPMAREKSR